MKFKSVLILFAIVANSYYGLAQKDIGDASASKLIVSASSDNYLSTKLSEAFDALTVNPEYIINNTGISTFRKEDFDFENLYISYVKGEPGRSIMAPYKGKTTETQFGFAITEDGATYGGPMLVKSISDRSNCSFYDLSDGATLSIDKAGKSFTYQTSTIQINNTAARSTGCGQAVMDCITDAYSNHGWVSVWASIQSIFIPATGVAIATACIVRNCIRH